MVVMIFNRENKLQELLFLRNKHLIYMSFEGLES